MKAQVGLVGVGYWGKNLARNFHQLGALRAICDRDPALLAERLDSLPGTIAFSSLEELLADEGVTCVAIALPAEHHYAAARSALLAGKDVYVEKPLCLSQAEGEELVELARRGGLILMVGHLLQYHPCVCKLQEMVDSGLLGKLHYIVSNRLNLGKVSRVENSLWSLAPHDLSVILSLVGSELPQGVRCTGGDFLTEGVADLTVTTLAFKEGVRAHIYVSWLHPFKEQKLTVIGSEGMVVFNDTEPWERKLLFYSNPLGSNGGAVATPVCPEGVPVEVAPQEPLRLECRHFLDCCESRVAPRTDGEEGLRVLRLLEAAQASLLRGGELYNPAREYEAHPQAQVDPEAVVGAGSKIWHYSRVMAGAQLGPRCNLGQNVVVHGGVRLGANVKVQNNVSLYSGLEVEEDVFIGPGAVFTNIKNPRSAIVRRDHYLSTLIRRGSTIGANATILCGIELGEYSFVGAGSVVTADVKPYALVVGSPGRQVGWVGRAGHRLDLPLALEEGTKRIALCPETGELYSLEGALLTYLGPQKSSPQQQEIALAER